MNGLRYEFAPRQSLLILATTLLIVLGQLQSESLGSALPAPYTQSPVATLSGTAFDETGALVPDVDIVLVKPTPVFRDRPSQTAMVTFH
ncbi:MAG: hypothetical protein AABO57_09030 [Acidobacteriota bacterium]